MRGAVFHDIPFWVLYVQRRGARRSYKAWIKEETCNTDARSGKQDEAQLSHMNSIRGFFLFKYRKIRFIDNEKTL